MNVKVAEQGADYMKKTCKNVKKICKKTCKKTASLMGQISFARKFLIAWNRFPFTIPSQLGDHASLLP